MKPAKAATLLRAAIEAEIRWLEDQARYLSGLGVVAAAMIHADRAASLRGLLGELDGPDHVDGHAIAGRVSVRKQ
jgi:hypothetical protein